MLEKITNMNEIRYFINASEFECLYFCLHFFKAFQKNISTECAEVIESTEKAIIYCKHCKKKDIRKFVFSDSLSDAFFLKVMGNFV